MGGRTERSFGGGSVRSGKERGREGGSVVGWRGCGGGELSYGCS